MLPTHLSGSDPSPACRTRAWGQRGPPALVAVLSSLLLSWCPALRTWCGPAHRSRGFASHGWWLFSRSVMSHLFATPWMAAHQTSLPFTTSWSLLRLMSTESVMPSNRLVQLSPPVCSPSHGAASCSSIVAYALEDRSRTPRCLVPHSWFSQDQGLGEGSAASCVLAAFSVPMNVDGCLLSQPQRKGDRRAGGTAGGPLWVDRPLKAPPPPIFLLFLSLWERLVLVGTKGRSGGNGRGSARAPGARHVPAWTWTPCGDRAPASSSSPRPRGLPHRWYSGPPTRVSNWSPHKASEQPEPKRVMSGHGWGPST